MQLKLDIEKFTFLAKRYVWWESPVWACQHPVILLANIMNLGSWEAWQQLHQLINDDYLREVLKNAPAGYFSQRSWDYWHCKLDVLPIPSLPQRTLC